MKKSECLLFIILLAMVGIFIYSGSLEGDFIWDDDVFVKQNRYIEHWSYLPKIFSGPVGSGFKLSGQKIEGYFYRPLQEVSYLFDYSLWGLQQGGYHCTNVVLHILVSAALFWFVCIIFGDYLIAALTSSFFLVHPVHTEAVCYISGRGDPLALLFMLISFICYIKHNQTRGVIFLLASVVSFWLALLSKENSVILPVLLLLYHYTFKRKVRYAAFASIVVTFLVFWGLRLSVLHEVLPRVAVFDGFFGRIPGFFVAFAFYLKLLILPFHLHMEYGKPLFAFSDYRVIAGMLCMSLVLLLAFRKGGRSQLLFFSIGWFFISLLPVSNLYPIAFFMAEHNLYFPSIGFFLLVAGAVRFVCQRFSARLLIKIIVLSVIIFYASVTVRQNNYWNNAVNFYTRTLSYAPRSKRVLLFLAKEYYSRGQFAGAIDVYKRALAINAQDKTIYYDLGFVLTAADRYDEARQAFANALSIDANYALAYNGLGLLLTKTGNFQEAKSAFKKALEIDPLFAKPYYNLAFFYVTDGHYQEAKRLYRKALEINPDYEAAKNELAYIETIEKAE